MGIHEDTWTLRGNTWRLREVCVGICVRALKCKLNDLEHTRYARNAMQSTHHHKLYSVLLRTMAGRRTWMVITAEQHPQKRWKGRQPQRGQWCQWCQLCQWYQWCQDPFGGWQAIYYGRDYVSWTLSIYQSIYLSVYLTIKQPSVQTKICFCENTWNHMSILGNTWEYVNDTCKYVHTHANMLSHVLSSNSKCFHLILQK